MKPALSLLFVLVPSMLSCSSVTYTRGVDGTVSVTRRDFGRDVKGEYLAVGNDGDDFKHGSEWQNESETATSLIDSLERFGEAWVAMKGILGLSDNAASVDNTAVKQSGSTNRTQIKATESAIINRDREVTKRALGLAE